MAIALKQTRSYTPDLNLLPRLGMLYFFAQIDYFLGWSRELEEGYDHLLNGLSREISAQESNIWFADMIDEVEKELYEYFKDKNRCTGFCFEFWSRKKALLARRGLEWRTPGEMNPRVIFD